jgi:hypothetical protein
LLCKLIVGLTAYSVVGIKMERKLGSVTFVYIFLKQKQMYNNTEKK